MKAPVRFAVVGCGHIGKRHAAMIQGDERATLVAVVDRAWAEEADVSRRPWAPEARAFATLSSALTSLDVDVVVVATPNGSHIDLA
ncbi:MAG: Gfo/Idh/MocA family oxidoreductase, partial [Bacteroidota bacterium]|nr:Gfo/Idh/MocA family oxidoreductase [Bacteroidota bacterium]